MTPNGETEEEERAANPEAAKAEAEVCGGDCVPSLPGIDLEDSSFLDSVIEGGSDDVLASTPAGRT